MKAGLMMAAIAMVPLGGCMANGAPVASSSASADRTLVSAPAGEITGTAEGQVVAYKGIPFAQPPVGPLRWRAPQPVERFARPFAATEYASDCMQIPFAADAAPLGTPPAEDCLYLNVWKPADARADARLPVIVWIYGGGWVNGGSSPAVYSGAPTAAKGTVFVSFNYRLGRFGFFAHPALSAADADGGMLGNYGYMDQVAALRWVQANIAAFGGDPGNVTIMGESAGGSSVANLLTSGAATNLFHKAVAMSAPVRLEATWKPLHADNAPDAEDDGLAFAKWAGIEGEGAQALAALRALPADRLTTGVGLGEKPGVPASGPMIDGRILRGSHTVLAANGQAKVPTMAGAVSEDIGWGPELAPDALFATFPDPAAARRAYASFAADPAALRRQVYQDQFMQEPARFLVKTQAAAGVPAYFYRYGYVADSMRDEWTGTQHATEIPFFLNTLEARYPGEVTAADQSAAGLINDYLVNFARAGDPNGTGLPRWPRFTADNPALMNITFTQAIAGPDPWQDRLDMAEALARKAKP